MYDIIIIGSGPAGSTLARLLDRKFKILLIDKRNLTDSINFKREKCCGGLLAPAAQKALARQGLGVPNEVLMGPQTFSVKSVDLDNDITCYYQRHYININREKFDRWLVSLISDNVEMSFSSIFKSYKRENGHFRVIYEKDNVLHEVKTSILIGADGAVSRVRDQTFQGKAIPRKYVSIQEQFKVTGVMPYYVSVFDNNVSDFYSWIIQKSDELLVGTAIPEDSDIENRYNILIEKLKELGLIQGKALKRTGAVIMRPDKLNQIHCCSDKIALIGEAAGFISPSSAEGISYALESGRLLAVCLNKNHQDFEKAYRKKLIGLKMNLMYKKLKVLLMYNGIIRKIIMKTRLLSMEVEER